MLQLHAESRGGWTILLRAPCMGLRRGVRAQATVRCATLVFPRWAVWRPPPWGLLQRAGSLRAPGTVHPTHVA